MRGTVVALSQERRLGYIASSERMNDVVFYISDLDASVLCKTEPLVGREVNFDVVTVNRMKRAIRVSLDTNRSGGLKNGNTGALFCRHSSSESGQCEARSSGS